MKFRVKRHVVVNVTETNAYIFPIVSGKDCNQESKKRMKRPIDRHTKTGWQGIKIK